MGPTELDLQSAIVDAANKAGIYGTKINQKYLAGFPDILLITKETGSVFIEVKKLEKNSTVVLLSPIQVRILTKMKIAGAKLGVMTLTYLSAGNYQIWVTKETDRVRLDASYKRFDKVLQKDWPLQEILEFLTT